MKQKKGDFESFSESLLLPHSEGDSQTRTSGWSPLDATKSDNTKVADLTPNPLSLRNEGSLKGPLGSIFRFSSIKKS